MWTLSKTNKCSAMIKKTKFEISRGTSGNKNLVLPNKMYSPITPSATHTKLPSLQKERPLQDNAKSSSSHK